MDQRKGAWRAATPSGPAGQAPRHSTGIPFNDRRVVSILFADLVGSTRIIAGMDPDDTQEFLDGVIDHMVESVHYFGGSVSRIQGDGIMAIFGAPYAQEDHATRAVLAGLRIQTEWRHRTPAQGDAIPVAFRVGVHSGPVIVRWQQNDFGQELDSVGSTVHVAAHIEALCPQGSVAVSAVTRQFFRGQVVGKQIGIVEAGEGPGMPVYALDDVSSQLTLTPQFFGQPLSDLVGRNRQLEAIDALVADVCAGRMATLAAVGEAGFGKSRLAYEATSRASQGGAKVIEVRGSSIKRDTPFAPVAALLAQLLAHGRRQDVDQLVARLDGKGLPTLQRLGAELLLLGRQSSPVWAETPADERIKAMVGAVRTLITEASHDRPILLVAEDLHFMDRETQNMLMDLVSTLQATPVGLMATARPESEAYATALCDKVVRTEPLSDTVSRELVLNEYRKHTGMPEAGLQDAMVDYIVQRSAGCPFAIEAFLRSADFEAKAAAFDRRHLPISLDAVLRARLDQLSPEARATAEMASVLGPDSALDTLRQMLGQKDEAFYANLYSLVEHRILSVSDGSRVRFSHQLLMEACYDGIVRKRRRLLHGQALTLLESRKISDFTPFQDLARHAYAAGHPEQALAYLWKACVAAIENAATYTVAGLYRKVLALCEEIGASADQRKAKFTLLVFDAFQQLGQQEELKYALEQAVEAFDTAGNAPALVQANLHLATIHWILGEQEEADRYTGQIAWTDELRSSIPLRCYAEFTQSNIDFASGRPVAAVNRLRDLTSDLTGPLETARFGAMISIPGVTARAFSGWYMTDIGALDEAEQMLLRAVELGDRLDHGYSRMLAALGYGYWMYRTGHPDAVSQLQKGVRLCLEGSYYGLEPIGSGFLASALLERDKVEDAAAVLGRSFGNGHHERTGNAGNYYLAESEAWLKFKQDDHGDALKRMDNVVFVTAGRQDLVHHAYALAARADMQAILGDETAAKRDYLAAQNHAASMGMGPLRAKITRVLAG